MWIQKCGLWIRVLPNVDPEMWIVDQGFPKCGLWIRVFPNMDPEIWIDCGSGTSLKEHCHSANI